MAATNQRWSRAIPSPPPRTYSTPTVAPSSCRTGCSRTGCRSTARPRPVSTEVDTHRDLELCQAAGLPQPDRPRDADHLQIISYLRPKHPAIELALAALPICASPKFSSTNLSIE